MGSVTCELPWPPSANHAWRPTNAGGKILAEPYRVFIKTVGDYVLEQRVRRHWTQDRLAAGLVFYPPNARTFDIDNRVKTVLDALVRAGVIVDDRYVDMIVLLRGQVHAPHGATLVHIEEMSTLPERFPSFMVSTTRRGVR